jgi:serine/threonine protein kinase
MSPTDILEKMRLAEGVELIPIREINDMPEFKDIEYEADDYVLNKVRSRHRSKIISKDMAMFLKNFEKPSTIVEAVIDYASVVKEDPTQMLADAHPFIMDLLRDELLVFQWDNATGSVFKAGDVFEGYIIQKMIHQIEDTEIYEAHTEGEADKTVILKVGINKNGQDKITHHFDNEAVILKTLSNSVNAKFIAHGERDGNPYIVLEKIENTPLIEYANRLRAKSQFQELVQLMKNIVVAYNQLHKEGVYHIDINPRNILINQEGKIYIIDFGLSCSSDSKTRLVPPLDYFSPPEILMFRNGSKRHWDFFCEQYSIAAVIYYLYTGKHPINFSFEGEVMQRQLIEEPVLSFEEQDLAAFDELEQLLKRCLEKKPELRYPDLDEIIAGLDSLQHGKFPEIVQREYALDNLLLYDDTDDLIDVLATEKTIREYFDRGPSCSIFNGGAGIAYFLYRMALCNKSAELISLADVWCNRSKAMSHEESAYINKELGFEAKDVDKISIFNHEPGLHFVQALISSSIGDINTTVKSVEKIIDISKSGSTNQDMTMGKSSILLALASIIESIPALSGFNNDAIIKYGNSLMSDIWDDKISTTISDDYSVKFTGVAHGWAGIIYAALRWHKAIGQPGPVWLENKINELFDVREASNDLIVWKNKINARNYYYMPGWCNGGAGFLELFRFAADIYQKAEYLDIAEKIAIDVSNNPSTTADLCCGFAGRGYALLGLYQSTQNQKYRDQAEALLAKSKQVPSFLKIDSLFKGKFGLKLLETEMDNVNPVLFPCM